MCCPPYDGDTSARSDHNQEDDVDDQHLDNLFLLPQGLATCGGLLLTKVFTSYIAGPVNAVRFLFFCTIVLCLYTAAAIIVRAVSRSHAICLCILSVALLVSTVIAASIPAVPSAAQGARHKLWSTPITRTCTLIMLWEYVLLQIELCIAWLQYVCYGRIMIYTSCTVGPSSCSMRMCYYYSIQLWILIFN